MSPQPSLVLAAVLFLATGALADDTSPRVRAAVLGQQAVRFEANRGQTDPSVDFVARCRDYVAWVQPTGVVFGLPGTDAKRDVVEIRLAGAQRVAARTSAPLPGVSNHLIGRDESKWVRGVPGFGSARYDGVWPGVAVTYRDDGGRLAFDFDVAAGADPSAVVLDFRGACDLSIEDGALRVETAHGALLLSAPVAWQDGGAARRAVVARWRKLGELRAGFEVAGHDPALALTIDPTVTYGTFLGGFSTEFPKGVAASATGEMYLAGTTISGDFPATAGAFDTTHNALDVPLEDVWCAKFDATGQTLVYATYIGGALSDRAFDFALAADGAVVVHGWSASSNFPTTSGVVEPARTVSGSTPVGFVLRLNASGSALVWSTYLNYGYGAMALDASGTVHVAHSVQGTNAPRIVKLNAAASAVTFTYTRGTTGDTCAGIAVDGNGRMYVAGVSLAGAFPTTAGAFQTFPTGTDCFVMAVDPNGTLVYATLLGGSNVESATDIACNASGNAFVIGTTASDTFPTANAIQTQLLGSQDAFVTKFNATGTALAFSTYLGGSAEDYANAIVVTGRAIYVGGYTTSANFPVTAGALQSSLAGSHDATLAVLRINGTLQYATYYGGSSIDTCDALAVDGNADVYLHMRSNSANLTLVNPFDGTNSQTDSALVRVSGVLPPLTVTGGAGVLPAWTRGVPFSQQLAATSGSGSLAWAAAGGDFPAGMSISPSGLFAGSPASAGTFVFYASVTDSAGTVAGEFTWVVSEPPSVNTVAAQRWTVTRPFQLTLSSVAGTGAVTWSSQSGQVPPGLTLAPGGSLSGTPTATGSYAFVATATDAVGGTGSGTVSITVNTLPTITSTLPAVLTENMRFARDMTVTDGTPPFTWSIAGDSPFVDPIGAATGAIDSFVRAKGTYDYSVRATDAAGAVAERTFRTVLNPGPAIDTTSLPVAAAGRPYRATLEGSGGTPPTTWVVGGTLPPGLTLDTQIGRIEGAPASAGTTGFEVLYQDGLGAVGRQTLALTVIGSIDAAAGKWSETLEFDLKNRDPDVRYLELIGGTLLDVSVKPKKKTDPAISVSLTNSAGDELDLSAALAIKGNTARLKRFLVPATDRYFLTLTPETNAVETVAVTLKVTAPSSFTGTVPLAAGAAAVDVVVTAVAGAKASAVVKRADKTSPLVPRIAGFRQGATDFTGALVVKGKSALTMKLAEPLLAGEARLSLAAADLVGGDALWTVKLKNPKTYEFALPELAAGE